MQTRDKRIAYQKHYRETHREQIKAAKRASRKAEKEIPRVHIKAGKGMRPMFPVVYDLILQARVPEK